MTVRALMERLQVYNPDAVIEFYDAESMGSKEICIAEMNGFFSDIHEGPVVFLYLERVIVDEKEHNDAN